MLGSPSQPGLLDELANRHNTTVVFRSLYTQAASDEAEYGHRQDLLRAIVDLIVSQSFDSRFEQQRVPFAPRIIATCSQPLPQKLLAQEDVMLENNLHVLWLPHLDVRKQDLADIASAKIHLYERDYGLTGTKLSQEATRRLLDHSWAVGEPEFDDEISAALSLLSTERTRRPDTPAVLKSKHMLVRNPDESIRRRLLNDCPLLRDIIKSPWVVDKTLRYVVSPVFWWLWPYCSSVHKPEITTPSSHFSGLVGGLELCSFTRFLVVSGMYAAACVIVTSYSHCSSLNVQVCYLPFYGNGELGPRSLCGAGIQIEKVTQMGEKSRPCICFLALRCNSHVGRSLGSTAEWCPVSMASATYYIRGCF